MFHVNESANVWKYFKVTPFHNKGLLSELIMIIREQQFSLIAPKTQIHNSASSDVQAAFDFLFVSAIKVLLKYNFCSAFGITDACSTADCLVNLVEQIKRQRMKRQRMKTATYCHWLA